MNQLLDKLPIPPIREWSGAKTEELVRKPGGFGLGQVPELYAPDATTSMICGFCATGCSVDVHLKDGVATNVTPTAKYPVNIGMACPKGWEALTPLFAKDRATTPMIRASRGGELEECDWDTAMQTFCGRMKEVQAKHGKESVAFISTGQICFEEMAFLGSLAKFGMGVRHGDGNTRQCMATAVVSYKQSFGFDAPPYTYQDFEESDTIILVGSNLCIAHPIMWQRVQRNKNNPKIIVIDPRKTETAVAATHHYGIAPKSDLTFFYGIAHILIEKGWLDNDFIEKNTNKFDGFLEHAKTFTPEMVSVASGISEEELYDLAKMIHEGEKVSFWWTMGVNQGHEAVRTAQAIINLALMTGNIGKPGTGANSITGQCNAMGSRLFSNTTGLLGGHDFTNADDRQKVADILEIDVSCIPSENSWAYDQIIEGIDTGKIRGLWILATNTAHSWVYQKKLKELFGKLDFLVVQDMYANTDTAQMADLVLPAACWAEKDGCFINSERRIGLVKQVSKAPGIALSDFKIFRLIAEYWGCGDMFRKWTDPEAVFNILKSITKGKPCDITGVTGYRMIDEHGGIQWPLPADITEFDQQRRLFADGKFFHADQKAIFHFEAPAAGPESPDAEYPFVLLTGRGSSSQWHTQTRTGKSEVLNRLAPKHCYVEIHPADAEKIGIESNDLLDIESRRGKVTVSAFITPTVQEGQIFMAMHYTETNQLTQASFDPNSRQPNYKYCAVKVGAA
ncbi:MAG: molybdopterin oxidoreductase family protein [Akkermansiaceae bacterium]